MWKIAHETNINTHRNNDFYFLHRCFLSSITSKTQHDGCLIRSRFWLPFANNWVHSVLLVESVKTSM
jgi:hypothetical protein